MLKSKYIKAEEADYNYASFRRAKAHKEYQTSTDTSKSAVAWAEYSTWDETMKYMKKWISYQGYDVIPDGIVADNDVAYSAYRLRKVPRIFP